MSPPGGARYRFGPRERGGSLAGWRPGQILTVAVGLVIGVLVLRGRAQRGRGGGRGLRAGAVRRHGHRAGVGPHRGRVAARRRVLGGARGRGCRGAGRMGALRGVRLLRAGWQDMGVVHDRATRTLTAALSLRGRSFALLGPDEQDRRVGAWSSVLASLAREGSPVHRVQWVAASFPDDGRGVHAYLAAEAVADAASASTASYEALLADMDSHACAHDVVLAVQVRLTKSVEVGCAALAREVGVARAPAGRRRRAGGVGAQRRGPGPPVAAHLRGRRAERAGAASTASAEDPWPMAMEETWSSVRVDGMVHATFWVAEWPRIEVRSDFLAPLLLGSARSTFAVVMEPLGSDAAVRKVEASRTADLADSELRRRGGFVSTARHARESEVLAPARGGAGRGSRVLPLRGVRHDLGARTRRSSRRPATPCSTRPGRAGWPCAASTATRRRPTPARCRCAGGCAERGRTYRWAAMYHGRHADADDDDFVLPRIPASAGALDLRRVGPAAHREPDLQEALDDPRRDHGGGRRDAVGGLPPRGARGGRARRDARPAGGGRLPAPTAHRRGRHAVPLRLRGLRGRRAGGDHAAGRGAVRAPAGRAGGGARDLERAAAAARRRRARDRTRRVRLPGGRAAGLRPDGPRAERRYGARPEPHRRGQGEIRRQADDEDRGEAECGTRVHVDDEGGPDERADEHADDRDGAPGRVGVVAAAPATNRRRSPVSVMVRTVVVMSATPMFRTTELRMPMAKPSTAITV